MQNELNHAGVGKRLIAYLLDGVIIAIISTLVVYPFFEGPTRDFIDSNWFTLINGIYLMVVPAVWSGYTLAKRMVKIRVRKLDGSDVSLFDMFIRDFIGKVLLGALTFGITTFISLIMVSMKQRRAIHDYMAGTYVYSD
ncbi:RDD family protein [Salimicrobium halophilum]|uniref:Uncharacterized membrane protein YckC, RDD family n=1 Tax=Salimicrobium halophilum TaxID=86666 RepID=A0A1G8T1U8_9BACI|nr:RDD family protein [Salimicrobium halophilum]SDJ35508.1 Uncharacterized membrane protein YckC, RDD family [Salimicrobium halophilum]